MQEISQVIQNAIISTIVAMPLGFGAGLIKAKLFQAKLVRKIRKRAEFLEFRYEEETSVINKKNQDAFYMWLKDKRTVYRILSFCNAEDSCNISSEQMAHAKESFFVDAFHVAEISSWHEKEALRKIINCLFQYVEELFWRTLDEEAVFLFKKSVLEIRRAITEATETIIRQIQYKDSFAEYINNNEELVQEVSYKLDYRSQNIPFVGREDELREIETFCAFEEQICWWVIIGSGGSGKSRLVLEFIKQYTKKRNLLDSDWKMIFLRDEFFSQVNGGGKYKKWNTWTYENNLLLVVDYVQRYAREVAEWIEGLGNNISISKKIRILLLERTDGENALWFKGIFDSSILRALQYPKEFLHIQSLDKALLQVAMEYAKKHHQKIQDDVAKEALNKLKDIDPEARVLYYVMILEAIFEGGSWRLWNKEQLVKYIVDREERMLQSRFSNDTSAISRYNRLLAFCTATRELSIFNLPQNIPETIKLDILGIQNFFGNRDQICAAMQLIDNTMHPVTPDIIGEYTVLYIIDQYILQSTGKQQFINNLWLYDPENFSLFIYRLIEDNMYGANMQQSFNEIVEEMLFRSVPINNSDVRRHYAMLMWGLTAIGSMEQILKYIGILGILCLHYPDDIAAAESYAKGLFNLSCGQELPEKYRTIGILQELANRQDKNDEIQSIYAKGLFNLIRKQDMFNKAITLQKLEKLANDNSNNREIQIIYAKGLSNFSGFYVLEENPNPVDISLSVVTKLENIAIKQKEDFEIQTAYARGLVNLSSVQELPNIEITIRELENLSQGQTDNVEVQIEYAKGLSNLAIKQNRFERQETFRKLEKLSLKYNGNKEIRDIYEKLLEKLKDFS